MERVPYVGDTRDAARGVVQRALLGVGALRQEERVGVESDEVARCQLNNTVGRKFIRGAMLRPSVAVTVVVVVVDIDVVVLTKGLDWSRPRRWVESHASSSHILGVYTDPAAAGVQRYCPMEIQASDMASRSV